MYRADQQPSVAEEDQSLAAELRCPASGHHKPYAEEVAGGVVEGKIGIAIKHAIVVEVGLTKPPHEDHEGLQFTSGLNAMLEKSSHAVLDW